MELTVRFNGGEPLPLAYPNERVDTASVCGDTDNGFVSIMNWGNLDDGEHTAVVYDDGVEFDRSVFTVRRFREAFVKGASLTLPVQDFPHQGDNAVFTWSQATQHLELADAFAAPTSTDPPNCEGWVTGQGNGAYDSAAWVQACLEAGADPNARDADGSTPLHRIIYTNENGRAASLLLAAGADPNARNNEGRTPLLEAADAPGVYAFEVIVVLLEAGADPNAQDHDGGTALHSQMDFGEDRVAELERALIQAGADPNLLDRRGEVYQRGRAYRCITFECLTKKNYRMER
ncbi:MAG: ankyrin repeat domain-containing protein [Desulfurellaceae bacterium]|nr:ankyrin repeat domain-containing protein [Desulfurellaceae bacterium]